MKRFLSAILATILLVTMLPLSSLAAEDSSNREALTALVCTAFPEYSYKIKGENIIQYNSRSSEPVHQVHNEVRRVSDNLYALYVEYSDGSVIYGSQEYYYDTTFNEAYQSGNILYFKCGINLYNNYNSEEFVVSGIRFQIDHNGYDSITARGDISDSTTLHATFGLYNLTETSTQPAYASYIATFSRTNQLDAEITVRLYVESDGYRVSVV